MSVISQQNYGGRGEAEIDRSERKKNSSNLMLFKSKRLLFKINMEAESDVHS